MQEISATITQVTMGAQEVLEAADFIKGQAVQGNDFVDKVKNRANDVNDSVKESKENTNKMIAEISMELQAAIENSKSVNEIRVLADSSRETANSIQVISKNVTNAVSDLAKNAEVMVAYINSNILTDYDQFDGIAGQYHKDADNMAYMLGRFLESAESLKVVMEGMVQGIGSISNAIEESTQGTAVAADSAALLVASMNSIQEEAEDNREISRKLRRQVEKFKKIYKMKFYEKFT